jgi:hypothetical protein
VSLLSAGGDAQGAAPLSGYEHDFRDPPISS